MKGEALNAYKLNESIIRHAILNCTSAKSCAVFLRIHYNTFKKYAQLYVDSETGKTLFELAQSKTKLATDIGKKNRRLSSIAIFNIINGETVNYYSSLKLTKHLLHHGLLQESCSSCGYDQKRAFDYKAPLLLDFIDGDTKNGKLDNLRFLCFNCFFQLVGDVKIVKRAISVSYEDYEI